MEKEISTGKCSFCKGNFSFEEMTSHIKTCEPRKDFLYKLSQMPSAQKTGIYHLFVEDRHQTAYWMHLEIHSKATLRNLDQFLRDTWLECCGHMSVFTIEKKRYFSQLFEDPSPFWGPKTEEYDMDVELHQMLRPGLRFDYGYDFGTTTELALRVMSCYERRGGGNKIQLLARNDPPLILCDSCKRRKAALICTACSWSDEGMFCDLCAQRHECDEEMFLPIVNSPRTGQCGYTGHSWNPTKTIKDEDPCSCGSGRAYLHCCWIQDVLWTKKEKSKEAFVELKEAVEDNAFHSQDELQSFADDMMAVYNREPEPDFLELSSEQMARLLYLPLEKNADIVRLNRDISPELYKKAPIVRNAQIFLSALAEDEPLKATAKGNLPVQFAKKLFYQIEDSRFKKYIRFRSEENSMKVLTLRHILKKGGWIKKEKKQFKLTRRGLQLLKDGFSEQHFYRLLDTYAIKFNWAFLDRYPAFRIIQDSWLFSLFLLHKDAETYTADTALARYFIKAFPEIVREVDASYTSEFDYIARCFSLRFFERFCEYFGFVDTRRKKQKDSYSEKLFIKMSPLYKEYFIWEVQRS